MINWLVSDVFGLRQGRSLEAERIIAEAQAFMRGDGSCGSAEQDRSHQDLKLEGVRKKEPLIAAAVMKQG